MVANGSSEGAVCMRDIGGGSGR